MKKASQLWEARIRFEADGFTGASKRLAAVKRVLRGMFKIMGVRFAAKRAVQLGVMLLMLRVWGPGGFTGIVVGCVHAPGGLGNGDSELIVRKDDGTVVEVALEDVKTSRWEDVRDR